MTTKTPARAPQTAVAPQPDSRQRPPQARAAQTAGPTGQPARSGAVARRACRKTRNSRRRRIVIHVFATPCIIDPPARSGAVARRDPQQAPTRARRRRPQSRVGTASNMSPSSPPCPYGPCRDWDSLQTGTAQGCHIGVPVTVDFIHKSKHWDKFGRDWDR